MSHPQTLDDTPPASTSAAQAEPLLAAEGLTRRFAVGRNLPLLGGGRTLTAVSDVSFRVAEGETVGLVGESGCGKSTIGKLALGLLAPSAGKVLYRGELIPTDQGAAWRALRRQMQMVFQNPYGALNPRLTVGSQVRELLDTHDVGAPAERSGRVDALFEQVGLRTHMKGRYPHQMSGGQLQRAVIARALAVSPSFIVCDEAVAALDVSIQAQVINLLQDLQAERGLTYLFISHDLGVVRHVCDRILVMYLGRLVEEGPVDALFAHPRHPYTAALLDAAPDPDPAARRVVPPLQGDPPSPLDPPSGCVFRTRCPRASARCTEEVPTPSNAGVTPHRVACHHPL